MKVDPSDGKKLYTSSYDCTIRALDLENQQSVEVFSIRDSDYLISNFDMPLEGNEVSLFRDVSSSSSEGAELTLVGFGLLCGLDLGYGQEGWVESL